MANQLVHANKDDGSAQIKFDNATMAHVLEAYSKLIQSYELLSNPDVDKMQVLKEEKEFVQYCRDAASPE